MLTPMKVFLLLLLAAAIWYGFKFWRWQNRFRKEFQRQMEEAAQFSRPTSPTPPPVPDTGIDDLAPCPACNTYGVPGQMKSCGRADCPYPG
ncbi:conserved hypothetical protein [Rhodospirillaceae bacterium LM-1]|nr:conserved hypothetical protein [Rhodospirillaceae bacterium LM-1]